MPAGLEVVTDSGIVQIDSDSRLWVLIKKGTITVTKFNRNNNTNPTPYISVSGVCPVMFVAGASIHTVFLYTQKVGSEFRFYLASEDSGTVEYFIYDQAPPKASNFGLQVFAGDGALVFDSQDKHLRIVTVLQLNENGSVSLPAGKKYAATMTYPSRSFYPVYLDGDEEFTAEHAAGVRVNNATISVAAQMILIIPDAMSNGFVNVEAFYKSYSYARVVVADVTNH